MPVIFKPERYLINLQIKKFAHYIKGDILDVGAGKSDRYSNLFNKKKYVTTDQNPNFDVDIVANAQNLPIDNESYDSVISTQTLEHLPDPQKAVKEFYRVIKKGGYCLVTVPFFNELHDEPFDFWRFTKYSLEKIFKDSGFKIVILEQRGGFFAVICQLVVRYLINKFDLAKKRWGKLANPFFKVFAKIMFFLDEMDNNQKNRKFALGWLVLAQK